MKYLFWSLPVAALVLSACSDPSFSVNGKISDADGKTITLERADHAGYWVALDSVKLKDSGKFSFHQIAPAAPEIYRLSLDGNYIYFPIDSIESVTIDAPAARFASDFSISGSDNAVAMGNFEKELLAFAPKLSIPDSATNFKRRVFTSYLQEAKGSVVSYYILTKTINDRPLFDGPEDAKYFAAVATSFRQFRPEDPRTALLEATATEARRRINSAAGKKTIVQAQEITFLPISLPDESGTNVSLSQIAGHGVPVALIFSDLSDDRTPAMNIELKKLVESGALKIYNVGLDADGLTWRNAARNLPWTTVYASVSDARKIISDYQIYDLPTIFLIDGSGNLKARCESVADLRRQL